jgi:hypothetical protein
VIDHPPSRTVLLLFRPLDSQTQSPLRPNVPLSEKRRLAATLDAQLIVIEGSRHGTPFDSIHATNMGLLALFDDCRLPGEVRWNCDTPDSLQPLHFIGSLAEEHATAFDVSRIGA